ncbi:MAG TPA: DUF2911 domain-containing protein [Chitinophagaceae bacterium]|nr:DUF2911 domain-containing protein [Chitinophagaceae bacterium]
MYKFVLTLFLATFYLPGIGQSNGKLPELDRSSMDVCYFPNNYPILKIQNKVSEPPVARVIYSRPTKQGRKVFGELVEYGKVWRFGANEATEIEFFDDVKIGGKKVLKGRYTLYALVNENSWTFIVNKDTDVWGAFKYDPQKDLVRFEVPVEKTEEAIDALSMIFEKSTTGFNLVAAWEQVRVILPISL